MVDSFLAARIIGNGFYSLKTEDQLFIMLVHPAFAKYLTAPHARLSNVIDLYRWITKYQIDWNYLVNLLKRTHLKTAAWLTGSYGELLTGIPFPLALMDNIKPPLQ